METKGAPNSVSTMATGHVMQHGPGICQDMRTSLSNNRNTLISGREQGKSRLVAPECSITQELDILGPQIWRLIGPIALIHGLPFLLPGFPVTSQTPALQQTHVLPKGRNNRCTATTPHQWSQPGCHRTPPNSHHGKMCCH